MLRDPVAAMGKVTIARFRQEINKNVQKIAKKEQPMTIREKLELMAQIKRANEKRLQEWSDQRKEHMNHGGKTGNHERSL